MGLRTSVGQEQLFPELALDDPKRIVVGKFHRKAPDSARSAAYAVIPRTGTQRHRVLVHITGAGVEGKTDEELQLELRMGGNTERPRRVELVEGGWIVDSGTRRMTVSGQEAVVWILSGEALKQMGV